jgi:hypothetical protein
MLATFRCHISRHDVLALPAAAILCHCERASPLLEAGKAGSDQKREEGQDHNAQYPGAMSLTLFHRTLSTSKHPESFSQSLHDRSEGPLSRVVHRVRVRSTRVGETNSTAGFSGPGVGYLPCLPQKRIQVRTELHQVSSRDPLAFSVLLIPTCFFAAPFYFWTSSQHLPRLFSLAPALPQSAQAHHRPHFQRLRALLAERSWDYTRGGGTGCETFSSPSARATYQKTPPEKVPSHEETPACPAKTDDDALRSALYTFRKQRPHDEFPEHRGSPAGGDSLAR